MTMRSTLVSWFAPLLIHKYNQQDAMQRAATAKAQGLDPAVYGVPYPGNNNTSANTTTSKTGGVLTGAAVAALAIAAGGAGVVGLGKLIPTAAVTQTAPQATPGAWDAVTEELQPDGTWKQVKREHLKTP